MSWYLFTDVPSVSYRGKKVDGFQDMHRRRINLQWGGAPVYSPQQHQTYSLHQNALPVTLLSPQSNKQREYANIKVLTDNDEKKQEELVKLVKGQFDPKKQAQFSKYIEIQTKKRKSVNKIEEKLNEKQTKATQISKKIRYLENSLLPNSKRQNMGPIFDYDLNNEVKLDDSRVSGKSLTCNKKNESNVVLGNGYNIFTAKEEKQKDYTSQLQQMYQYEQQRRKRIEGEKIRLG